VPSTRCLRSRPLPIASEGGAVSLTELLEYKPCHNCGTMLYHRVGDVDSYLYDYIDSPNHEHHNIDRCGWQQTRDALAAERAKREEAERERDDAISELCKAGESIGAELARSATLQAEVERANEFIRGLGRMAWNSNVQKRHLEEAIRGYLSAL